MSKIKKRVSKNQFDTTEEIRSIAHNMSEQYHARSKQVNIILVIAVVILVAAGLYGMVKAGQEKSAGALFETAYASYGGTTGAGPNYDKALMGFQDVVKQYGSTLNGAIAQFYIGNTFARMGRNDEALKAYQECVKRYSGEKFIASLAYQRIGYLSLNLGKREDAMDAFRKAEALSGPGVSTLEQAHLFEQAGKVKESLEKYKELSEKLPATSFAMSARSKLPPPDLSQVKSGGAGTAVK